MCGNSFCISTCLILYPPPPQRHDGPSSQAVCGSKQEPRILLRLQVMPSCFQVSLMILCLFLVKAYDLVPAVALAAVTGTVASLLWLGSRFQVSMGVTAIADQWFDLKSPHRRSWAILEAQDLISVSWNRILQVTKAHQCIWNLALLRYHSFTMIS